MARTASAVAGPSRDRYPQIPHMQRKDSLPVSLVIPRSSDSCRATRDPPVRLPLPSWRLAPLRRTLRTMAGDPLPPAPAGSKVALAVLVGARRPLALALRQRAPPDDAGHRPRLPGHGPRRLPRGTAGGGSCSSRRARSCGRSSASGRSPSSSSSRCPQALHRWIAPGSAAVWHPDVPAAAAVLGPGPHPISLYPEATRRWLAFATGVIALALAAAPALRERRSSAPRLDRDRGRRRPRLRLRLRRPPRLRRQALRRLDRARPSPPSAPSSARTTSPATSSSPRSSRWAWRRASPTRPAAARAG